MKNDNNKAKLAPKHWPILSILRDALDHSI